MKMKIIRDLLIVLGIYWLSIWVVVPITVIYFKITTGITYSGNFGTLLMGVISSIPTALVALGAGILAAYMLESGSRKYCLAVLALLYAVFGFLGHHWVQEPRIIDRIFQVVQSVIPAIVCFLGGSIVIRRQGSRS
jgi:hypothetical protein